MTEWRRVPIAPYRSYEASDDGRVRRNGKELAGHTDRYGYRNVQLSYAGLPKHFKVHRLVCETFHGPCPDGLECAHLDGDKANNAAANLAWVTRSENTRHQILHGTFVVPKGSVSRGETNGRAKLTAAQVVEMREGYAAGVSTANLGRRFGVSKAQAHRIVSGNHWADASEETADAQPSKPQS